MSDYRESFLVWLKQEYDDAVRSSVKQFCWCLDLAKKEDVCLAPDGFTTEQMQDEISKKSLPLRILRVFSTAVPLEAQVTDL